MILGLDLGTRCGWALLLRDGSRHSSGTWDLTPRRSKRAGLLGEPWQRLHALQGHLREVREVALCGYELVRRHTGTQAAHVYGALEGVLQLHAHEQGWHLRAVAVGEVKARLSGAGRASKGAMVEAARLRWGLEECGEDEADALGVALATLDAARGRA